MGALISVVIISLFLAIVIVKKIDIAWYIKNWMNIHQARRLKPLDCLPCFTFWVSIPVSLVLNIFVFNNGEIFTWAVSIMASFVAAYIIEK